MGVHAEGLHGERREKIGKMCEKHCRKKIHTRKAHSYLGFTFGEMYRVTQAEQGVIGPIFIYCRTNVLLFLAAIADHRFCRIINFAMLL